MNFFAALTKKLNLLFLHNEDRYFISILFLSALCNGLYEVAIIREFTVAAHSVQSIAYLLFAFLHLFFGAGSYLAYRFFHLLILKKRIKELLLLSGLSIVVSLFFILKIRVDSFFSVITSMCFVSLVFILIGTIYGVIIVYFTRHRSEYIGIAVAFSLGGLIAGFILEPPAVVCLGVNALCLLVGIACIFLYKKSRYFFTFVVTGVVLCVTLPIDRGIETLRAKKLDTNYRVPPQKFARDYKEIFNGWSVYSKLNIYMDTSKEKLLGAYNYKLFWVASSAIEEYERVPFNFIGKKDRVLVIGASAGREAFRFPADRAVSKENTTMVEIDPLVVRYFKKDHPEYNDYLFNRVDIRAADGRSVLDEMTGRQDVIIIGSLESSATNIWMLNELKNYLFTYESLERCFQVLNDKGVLMIYQDYPFMIRLVCATLEKLHIPFTVIRIPFFYRSPDQRDRYFVYASRDKERLSRIERGILFSGIASRRADIRPASLILTDDRPFINLAGPQRSLLIATLIKCLGFVFPLMCVCLFWAGRGSPWEKIFYFFVIGNGLFLTQLFMLAKFRSFFSHPLKTIITITAIFLSSVAIGSLISGRIQIEYLKKRVWLHALIVCSILAYFYFAISFIPFFLTNYFLKLLVSVLIILPMGVLCGIFYPLGLAVNKNRNLGLALFFDGLGTASAFLLFYTICALYGISANFLPIAVCYIAATFLIAV